MADDVSRADAGRLRWFVLGGAALLLVALGAVLPVRDWSLVCHQHLVALGWWGAVGFVLVMALWNLVLPPFPLQVLAGFAYGFVGGLAVVFVGSLVAMTSGFLLARGVLHGPVQRALQRRRLLRAIDRAVAREGWKAVFLVRLSSCIPSNLSNYAFGLTRLPLRTVLIAGCAGKLPGLALSVAIGATAEAGMLRDGRVGLGSWTWPVLVLAVVGSALFFVRLARSARAEWQADLAAPIEEAPSLADEGMAPATP